MYKNCVIRYFNKPPRLVMAKESYIKKIVAQDPDTLMIAYYPSEKMALEMVKLASKSWNGVYIV